MEWSKLVPELMVTNMAESLSFYTEVLGFIVLYSRGKGFAYLQFEGAQLMLEAIEPEGWHTGELTRPFGRGINLQIECADARALRDRIVGAGYSLFRDLAEKWYEVGNGTVGALEFLVQDPDGYLLRFAQDLGERVKT